MKENRCKVFVMLFIMITMCILLCSCSREEPGPKTVIYNGTTYTIDEDAMTIFDGKNTYGYEVQGNGSSVNYHIYYPNGSTYYWTWSGNVGHGGWSDDYDENLYAEGRTLMNVLEMQMPRESEPKNVLVIFVLLAIGIFNAVSPQTAWYLSDGWKYKDAEPSEMALGMTRFGGIVAIIIAVFMMFA